MTPVRDPTGEWRWLMQAAVTGLADFNLIAVWAFNHRQVDKTPLSRALDLHKDFIEASPTIVVGDFNNNAIWDKPGKSHHADTVNRLNELGMSSAYHAFHSEAHGEESRPTYWHYRHQDKPYHIDYCYPLQRGRLRYEASTSALGTLGRQQATTHLSSSSSTRPDRSKLPVRGRHSLGRAPDPQRRRGTCSPLLDSRVRSVLVARACILPTCIRTPG